MHYDLQMHASRQLGSLYDLEIDCNGSGDCRRIPFLDFFSSHFFLLVSLKKGRKERIACGGNK